MKFNDENMMDDRESVVKWKVDKKKRRERRKNEGEDDGNKGEDRRMCRIGRSRVNENLKENDDENDDRKEEDNKEVWKSVRKKEEKVEDRGRIGWGKIMNKEKEGRMENLNGEIEKIVEREEKRNMKKKRKEERKRIDIIKIVKINNGMMMINIVVRIFIEDLSNIRMNEINERNRIVWIVGEREEKWIEKKGEEKNGEEEIECEIIDKVDEIENRIGDEVEKEKVDKKIEMIDVVFSLVVMDSVEEIWKWEKEVMDIMRMEGRKSKRRDKKVRMIEWEIISEMREKEGEILVMRRNESWRKIFVGDEEKEEDEVIEGNIIIVLDIGVFDLMKEIMKNEENKELMKKIGGDGMLGMVEEGKEEIGGERKGWEEVVDDSVVKGENIGVVKGNEEIESEVIVIGIGKSEGCGRSKIVVEIKEKESVGEGKGEGGIIEGEEKLKEIEMIKRRRREKLDLGGFVDESIVIFFKIEVVEERESKIDREEKRRSVDLDEWRLRDGGIESKRWEGGISVKLKRNGIGVWRNMRSIECDDDGMNVMWWMMGL